MNNEYSTADRRETLLGRDGCGGHRSAEVRHRFQRQARGVGKMKKVAIVGVESSGKTVMLAGLGDLYTYPDADGYFLAP